MALALARLRSAADDPGSAAAQADPAETMPGGLPVTANIHYGRSCKTLHNDSGL